MMMKIFDDANKWLYSVSFEVYETETDYRNDETPIVNRTIIVEVDTNHNLRTFDEIENEIRKQLENLFIGKYVDMGYVSAMCFE